MLRKNEKNCSSNDIDIGKMSLQRLNDICLKKKKKGKGLKEKKSIIKMQNAWLRISITEEVLVL